VNQESVFRDVMLLFLASNREYNKKPPLFGRLFFLFLFGFLYDEIESLFDC
jgi:hypothetical protein